MERDTRLEMGGIPFAGVDDGNGRSANSLPRLLGDTRRLRSSAHNQHMDSFSVKGEASLELLIHSDLFDWRAPIRHKKVVSKRRRVRHCSILYGYCHSFFRRA